MQWGLFHAFFKIKCNFQCSNFITYDIYSWDCDGNVQIFNITIHNNSHLLTVAEVQRLQNGQAEMED